MARIRLNGLTKRFGSVIAVDHVALDVADREFLVLVGPSGCGKTTTLRMVAGLEEITEGEIYIGDRIVNNVAPKDRDIAMVFQNYALYPHMSVYDNMGFGLQMRHVPRQEIARRINEAAELLGLTHLLKRRPRELSGGQRQRVALGRAIVRDPAVFLMDEPLSNLDAQLRVQTRTEILRLHQRVTSTVMYVTHDQVEAMTMGDRIVVMKDGVVQQVDAPKAIYDHPRNRFVAGFIGSPPMNFLDCSLEREAGALYLRGASFRLRIPNARARALEHARSDVVTLGFRPEDVQIGPESGAATQPDASIPARIEVVETLGSEQHVFLTSDGASMLARVSADFSVRDGESVTALLNPAKLHVFDRDSGAAYTV